MLAASSHLSDDRQTASLAVGPEPRVLLDLTAGGSL